MLTPKNDTLCWHQLDIILLKHPFVVRFSCRFIQLTKRPFIYFRGLSGERATPPQSESSSGNTSSHHREADVLPSAVNAWELRSFLGWKWGSQQPSSTWIRQPFICNHSFLSKSGLSLVLKMPRQDTSISWFYCQQKSHRNLSETSFLFRWFWTGSALIASLSPCTSPLNDSTHTQFLVFLAGQQNRSVCPQTCNQNSPVRHICSAVYLFGPFLLLCS